MEYSMPKTAVVELQFIEAVKDGLFDSQRLYD